MSDHIEDEKPRPAIWIPGVLRLVGGSDGRARVGLGRERGWVLGDPIVDWQLSALLVSKPALTDELRRELAIDLPEERLDAACYPRLCAAARAASLVAVAPQRRDILVSRDVRTYRVAWHRGAGGGEFSSRGGGLTYLGVGGEMYGWLGPDAAEGASDSLIDRILRRISDGEVGEDAVMLAVELATVTNPELIERSQPARRDPALDEARRADWESWLEQTATRSASRETDAKAIVTALENAIGDEVQLPSYGTARRIRLPELAINTCDSGDADVLTLPPYSYWIVEGVETWFPDEVFRHRGTVLAQRRRRRRAFVAILITLALLAVALLMLQRR
jgi:hypothetical protein